METPFSHINASALRLLPDRLLNPGETPVLCMKPSLILVILLTWRTFLTVAALTALLVAVGPRCSTCLPTIKPGWLIITLWIIFGLHGIWALLRWAGLTYILTDKRIIRTMGVININIFQCELSRIQHTQLHFSLLERLFHLGSISFSTAGTGAAEAYWTAVAYPLTINQILSETLKGNIPENPNNSPSSQEST